jgi:hypothetical protein
MLPWSPTSPVLLRGKVGAVSLFSLLCSSFSVFGVLCCVSALCASLSFRLLPPPSPPPSGCCNSFPSQFSLFCLSSHPAPTSPVAAFTTTGNANVDISLHLGTLTLPGVPDVPPSYGTNHHISFDSSIQARMHFDRYTIKGYLSSLGSGGLAVTLEQSTWNDAGWTLVCGSASGPVSVALSNTSAVSWVAVAASSGGLSLSWSVDDTSVLDLQSALFSGRDAVGDCDWGLGCEFVVSATLGIRVFIGVLFVHLCVDVGSVSSVLTNRGTVRGDITQSLRFATFVQECTGTYEAVRTRAQLSLHHLHSLHPLQFSSPTCLCVCVSVCLFCSLD